MAWDFDSIVVGAGIVGIATARALARTGSVLVVEACGAAGTMTSSRNSGVIHAGLYYPPGSLRARLCVSGRRALYAFCAEAGVAHRACGKLVVAVEPDEMPALQSLHDRARLNGVEDIRLLTAAEARRMEPALQCAGALWSPVTGIVDAHGCLLALLGAAEASGTTLALRTRFDAASRLPGGGFSVLAGGAAVSARNLVIAAGHGAPDAALRVDALDPAFIPKAYFSKGNYFTLGCPHPFTRQIYPMPVPGGAGIHLTLDMAGAARFGPDVEAVDRFDHAVDPDRAGMFYAAIRRYWPGLPDGALQPAWAGMRPKIVPAGEAADFMIAGPETHGVDGLVALFGIESPGLTSCIAIGDEVAGRLDRSVRHDAGV